MHCELCTTVPDDVIKVKCDWQDEFFVCMVCAEKIYWAYIKLKLSGVANV